MSLGVFMSYYGAMTVERILHILVYLIGTDNNFTTRNQYWFWHIDHRKLFNTYWIFCIGQIWNIYIAEYCQTYFSMWSEINIIVFVKLLESGYGELVRHVVCWKPLTTELHCGRRVSTFHLANYRTGLRFVIAKSQYCIAYEWIGLLGGE